MSITEISNVEDSGIYTDLIREFIKENWFVSIFYGTTNKKLIKVKVSQRVELVPVFIGKYEKTNIIRKGLSLLAFDKAYRSAIKDYSLDSLDLVLYATPPINLTKTIYWIKRRYSCKSYLLLKDIFPQNAVDIGLLSRFNPLYHYFSYKEKKLYELSDVIGCMSPENKSYVSKQYPSYSHKLEINPNSIDLSRVERKSTYDINMLIKYGIPRNKKIVVYGGNLGLPQGIPFLLEFFKYTLERRSDIIFVIAGRGTQCQIIEDCSLDNLFYVGDLSVPEFNKLVSSSDIGLISLDRRFTIPNFPSRLLSYLSNSLPVLCLVDSVTDIGRIAEENGFGRNAIHGDLQGCFESLIDLVDNTDSNSMANNALRFLLANYGSKSSYKSIINHLKVI